MPYVEWRGSKCRVRWDTGQINPDTGKKIYDGKSGFTDEDEAYKYGLDRESDVRNDRYISRRDGSVLMKEYCRTWLDTLDVGHLREKTVRSIIRLYILPRWGETAVGDIKASAYKAWRKQVKALPHVGDRYASDILGVFSMLMDDAVDDELRTSSPVPRKRRRGRYKKKPREKKREMHIEDVHQLACNALTMWGFTGFVFIWTMACTGMRPAELYSLRRDFCHPNWPASDPDPDRRAEATARYISADPMPALRVEDQHQREGGNGAPKRFPPKYESHRDLVIPPFLAELLEMLLDSHTSELVFPSIEMSPLASVNFSYSYWRPIADGRPAKETFTRVRLGQHQTVKYHRPLPVIPATPYAGKRLYLLRHGHKEWLDEDGHSRIATETRMGHELAGVEGLYANVTIAMERSIIQTLQDRWVKFIANVDPNGLPASPSPLPVDLREWLTAQINAATGRHASN